MITGPRQQFVARVTQRGYTLAEVAECIVAEDGDTITVDETHPAYPRPTLAQKAKSFAASAAAHVAAGMPQTSEAERERRFAICQGCEHYDGRACTQCGCPIVREQRWVSKLAWAGESCPVGKWGAEAHQS